MSILTHYKRQKLPSQVKQSDYPTKEMLAVVRPLLICSNPARRAQITMALKRAGLKNIRAISDPAYCVEAFDRYRPTIVMVDKYLQYGNDVARWDTVLRPLYERRKPNIVTMDERKLDERRPVEMILNMLSHITVPLEALIKEPRILTLVAQYFTPEKMEQARQEAALQHGARPHLWGRRSRR